MKFITDLTHRDGKGSSKKLWFNIACLIATIIICWVAYKDTMEDYAFIVFYAVYLACIGGFEIIPKLLGMIIEFKNGGKNVDVIVDKPQAAD
jgi:hypothetical protein